MTFEHPGHQSIDGTANGRDLLKNRATIGTFLERALECVDLTFDAADAGQNALFLFCGVWHFYGSQYWGVVHDTILWGSTESDRHALNAKYQRPASSAGNADPAVSFAVLALALFFMDRLNADGPIKLVIVGALLVVSGICSSAWIGIANAELAVQVGIRRVGTALGMCNTSVYTALFFAPYITPIVAKAWSWPAVWVMASSFAFAANMLFRRS